MAVTFTADDFKSTEQKKPITFTSDDFKDTSKDNTPQGESGDDHTGGMSRVSALDYWIKNPAKAAGKAIMNDVNLVTHPLDTAVGMAKGIAKPFQDVAKDPKGQLKQFGKDMSNPGKLISDAGKSVGDMVMNHPLQTAAMVLPGAEGAVGLAEKGVGAAKTAMTDIGKKNLENNIFGLYNDSVGVKIKNLGDVSKVKPQRITALKAMSDNLPNVKLESGDEVPKSRWDMAQTLRQTKQDVYKKYTQLSGDATESGAKIDMTPVIQKAVNDTIKSIGQDALKANPRLLKSLQQEAINVSKIGITTPIRAQEYMASLNKELAPLYSSGKGTDFSVLDFKRNLINHLNDATESTIENTLKKSGYGELRDQYAALKSSEKEIVNAANKYMRQQGGQGGGIAHPIVNLWSIEQVMESGGHLMTGNIAGAGLSLARAATIKMASKFADFLKNPDAKVSKMFDLLKKYEGKKININENVSDSQELQKIGQ